MENKFICDNIPVIACGSLDLVFNDVTECLKSEGVDLTISDVAKAYEVYLRAIGLAKGTVEDNPKRFCSISSVCGVNNIFKAYDDMLENDNLTNLQELYQEIHIVCDNDRAWDNKAFDIIKNNTAILFKEFDILTNELFADIIDKFNNELCLEYEYNFFDPENRDYNLSFTASKDILIHGILTVLIESTLLSRTMSTKSSIILDSFDEDDKSSILRGIEFIEKGE